MTISHPGKVTIHGDLYVTGKLSARGHSLGTSSSEPIPLLPDQGGKADNARPEDVRNLQAQIDQLWSTLNIVIEHVNRIQ